MNLLKKIIRLIAAGACLAVAAACSDSVPGNAVSSGTLPHIFPDYTNVTIPRNIAPLNFIVRGDSIDAVTVAAGGEVISSRGDAKAVFDLGKWHDMLGEHAGKDITVSVYTRSGGRWTRHKDFTWHVTNDTIDPYLTYRLIEPDYEVWNNVVIQQRCLEDFSVRNIADHNMQENRCMNCHIAGSQLPSRSMLYVRGKGGGAILNNNGHLRLLNLKADMPGDSMVSSSVYFDFAPKGQFITFSTNLIIPAFYSKPGKRMEVYDAKSDVYIADLTHNIIYTSPLLADSSHLETFPTFSPDGRYIYYCSAPALPLPRDITRLRYALVRVPFDSRTARIGRPDTLFTARSVCMPRVSPDGRYIVFTVANYGTFPIWHREADLWKMDITTGRIDTMKAVNSKDCDTWHSWSANSRWMAFASKRDDGLFGRPFFCYIDSRGHAHKPFELPQSDPAIYDDMLKSFNIPELMRGPLPFGPVDIQNVMRRQAELFLLKKI